MSISTVDRDRRFSRRAPTAPLDRGWLGSDAEPDHRLCTDIELAFSIHLFRLTVPQQRGRIRILLVAAIDVYGVYEGLGSWSRCNSWINKLSAGAVTRRHQGRLLRILEEHSYVAIPAVWIPLHRLYSLGFQRVDG